MRLVKLLLAGCLALIPLGAAAQTTNPDLCNTLLSCVTDPLIEAIASAAQPVDAPGNGNAPPGLLFSHGAVPSTAAAFRTQRTFTFPAAPAGTTDLHLEIKGGNAEVVTDADDKAGPFQNINGNGSGKIDLWNADPPIAAGDIIKIKLRTDLESLDIAKWWWTKPGAARGNAQEQAANLQGDPRYTDTNGAKHDGNP